LADFGGDNVIDNKRKLLRDVLLTTLPHAEYASFALGYFFISGFNVIIDPVKSLKKLRLLISNTTNQSTAEALIEGFKTVRQAKKELQKEQFVNQKKINEVKLQAEKNFSKSLEQMEQTQNDEHVVRDLIELMKSGKVEVRVYPKEKLHAKAYLFESNKDEKERYGTKGIGIVGSSNLSLAGMEHNSELNLRTVHGADYDHLVEWFETLWKDGIEYTENFEIILENSWAGKVRTPYEIYLKAMYHEVKDRLEGGHDIDPVWGSTFPKLYPFQRKAVDQALTMFELHGGLILGDVVGLGKTYVGTALLKYLQLQGYRPLIVCPPHLYDMWDKFCVEFEVDAKILSRGKLSRDDFELYQDYKYKDRDLVLIDESHHFRNVGSRQYENLHTFMQARDAKGILLTATPYANSAEDIKNQIMLFHSSAETTIPPAEGNLDRFFRKVKNGEADLVDLLRNIMIRRTRRYILNQWGREDEKGRKYLEVDKDGRLYFPERAMSTEGYKIEKVYQNKYNRIVDRFTEDHLTFARYSPGLYLKKEYQNRSPYNELKTTGPKLVALMKHLLLKRMESSLASFQASIANLINVHTIFLNLLREGIVPIGTVSQKEMYETALNEPDWVDDEQKIQEIAQRIKSSGDTKYETKAFDLDKLKEDVESDLETLSTIDGLIHRLTWKTDNKLTKLQELLDKFSNKKILVFTEFTTTAKYLDTYLKWKGNKRQVDSSTTNNLQILQRFDPEHNRFGDEKIKKEDQISLLISTDVLSEGVNLQAGEIVINYDFHWNPIRLIQRAGRVDRIGSEHEIIKIINFLPDPTIEHDLHLEGVVSSKIDEIQRVIGEDYKILKETENINEEDIYAIYRNEESILDEADKNNPLEPSEFERIITDLQLKDPKFWEDFIKIPDGIRSCEGESKTGQVLLACESGSIKSGRIRKYYSIDMSGKIKSITGNVVLKILKAEKDTPTSGYPTNYSDLISKGWNFFLEEIEQIQAREITGPKKSNAQKWVIEKLMKISKLKEFEERLDEIETLIKAFNLPLSLGKLNRELRKIQKEDLANDEILFRLGRLYQNFELKKEIEKEETETPPPRILYSKFIGKQP